MCRLVAYLGESIAINEILSKPKDSLIRQSKNAHETSVSVNADGFGIGWYVPQNETPAVYTSTLPAWGDINLKNISHHIYSRCFFGHVRATDESAVSQANCHPFHFKTWMMEHNGSIGGFKRIKRELLNALPSELFLHIKGQTDSEYFFMLWLHYFLPSAKTKENCLQALANTLAHLESLQSTHKVTEPNWLNIVITDGTLLLALRYVTRSEEALSLHVAAGKRFMHIPHRNCKMVPCEKGAPQSVLVASEALTEDSSEWQEIRPQHILFAEQKLDHIHLEQVDLKDIKPKA